MKGALKVDNLDQILACVPNKNALISNIEDAI
jgi:hypothetical protein